MLEPKSLSSFTSTPTWMPPLHGCHPYMDGNGRMGRFLTNALMAAAGYRRTIVAIGRRADYMAALESAGVDHDIRPFAGFLGILVRPGKDHPPHLNKSFASSCTEPCTRQHYVVPIVQARRVRKHCQRRCASESHPIQGIPSRPCTNPLMNGTLPHTRRSAGSAMRMAPRDTRKSRVPSLMTLI